MPGSTSWRPRARTWRYADALLLRGCDVERPLTVAAMVLAQRAAEIDPSDKGVKRELAQVVMKIKKQEEKEKVLFAKMFA